MILVLGASGMLGHQLWLQLGETREVAGTLRRSAPRLERLAGGRRRLDAGVDAADLASVAAALDRWSPAAVVNCVGVIKQLPAGRDPVACLRVNALFPHLLDGLCRERGVRLVHVSTDCVFNGRRGGYRESDPPDAEDLYGRSKALGELADGPALTLRTSIVGHELESRLSLLEWFLAQEGEVSGYGGARWSGVTTVTLARLVRDVVLPRPELRGLMQVAAEPLDKDALLRRFAATYGRATKILRREVPVEDRTLDGSRFEAATDWRAPAWDEQLATLRAERERFARLYD